MSQDQSQSGQGQSGQKMPKPGEPGYDATRDPNSPEYDASKDPSKGQQGNQPQR